MKCSAVLLTLTSALFACSCGASSKTLNTAKVERAIANSIVKERGLDSTVVCPAGIPEQAGHVSVFAARLDAGSYPVTVTELNGDGKVRYGDATPLVVLDVAKIERSIESSVFKQRRLRATASCPREVLQQAGLEFRCIAVIDGASQRYPFVVSEVDNVGHVRYLGT